MTGEKNRYSFFIEENLSKLENPDELQDYTSLVKSISKDNIRLRLEVYTLKNENKRYKKIIKRLLDKIHDPHD
jgi:hypothetical protein